MHRDYDNEHTWFMWNGKTTCVDCGSVKSVDNKIDKCAVRVIKKELKKKRGKAKVSLFPSFGLFSK